MSDLLTELCNSRQEWLLSSPRLEVLYRRRLGYRKSTAAWTPPSNTWY